MDACAKKDLRRKYLAIDAPPVGDPERRKFLNRIYEENRSRCSFVLSCLFFAEFTRSEGGL